MGKLDIEKVVEEIKQKQGLNNCSALEQYICKNDVDSNTEKGECLERFYCFEGINSENGIDVKVVIYDCSSKGCHFDYGLYSKMLNNEDGISIPITVFVDWDSEMESYFHTRERLDKTSDKRKLKDIFNTQFSMYTSCYEDISLKPDNDINYIRYKSNNDDELEGYVYNFSLHELKKIFNVKGKGLFDKNVRNGKNKGPDSEKLKKVFKNYINVFVYNKLMKKSEIKEKENENHNLMDILALDEVTLKNYTPENFWFYHNGITIFSYDDREIDRSGKYIKLNPQKISVINGAQTLTNFYMNLKLSEESLVKELNDYGISKKEIYDILDQSYRQTIVKTIIISGIPEYIHPITSGLNTQIPILDEHILADSKNVKELNQFLMVKKMEILKEGETSKFGQGMGVVEFAKLYLIYKLKPGQSKNFRKSGVENVIKEALKELKNENQRKKCLNALEMLKDVSVWWAKSKKKRDQLYDYGNEVILNAYGKNYFGSYIISNELFEDNGQGMQDLEVLFNKFVTDFKSIEDDLSLKDFKKDELFNMYLEKKENNINNNVQSQIEINYDELKSYINQNAKSQYSIAKVISDFLEKNGNTLLNFRVISRESEKCKEAFPFSNSSFVELYAECNDNVKTEKYLEFSESKFSSEIKKTFPVFVLEKKSIDGKIQITNIQYIQTFSFEAYNDDAKKVYEKTVEAFKKGDESLFPKISDGLSFHVRPKAMNSDDTFEFTNGEQITKRTFWANKETVNNIIDKKTSK